MPGDRRRRRPTAARQRPAARSDSRDGRRTRAHARTGQSRRYPHAVDRQSARRGIARRRPAWPSAAAAASAFAPDLPGADRAARQQRFARTLGRPLWREFAHARAAFPARNRHAVREMARADARVRSDVPAVDAYAHRRSRELPRLRRRELLRRDVQARVADHAAEVSVDDVRCGGGAGVNRRDLNGNTRQLSESSSAWHVLRTYAYTAARICDVKIAGPLIWESPTQAGSILARQATTTGA
ncbi:hypothetical protein PT2222_20222 [Paraburkholderia tropica]